MLQFNNLRVDQRKEPYIRVNTRELNRVLGTMHPLLYLAYTKDYVLVMRLTCIIYIIWHHCFSNLPPCSMWPCDHVTITVTISSDVTNMRQYDCDVILNPNPSFKRKIKKKIKKKNKIKRNLGPNFVSLTEDTCSV